MAALLFLFLAIGSYCIPYLLTKDKLHPCGILCFSWFVVASVSLSPFLSHNNYHYNWAIETYLAVILTGLGILLPVYIFRGKVGLGQSRIHINANFKLILNVLIMLSIISFAIRFYGVLLSPPFFNLESNQTSDLKHYVPSAIAGFNYFELLIPFLSLACCFELSHSPKKKRKIILIIYISFSIAYSLFYLVSRGTLLVILFGCLYLYVRRKKPSFIKIALALLTTACLFTFIAVLRINSGSMVFEYLGGDYFKFFSPIYTYTALSMENLNKLILSQELEYTYFLYSLKFILWPFFSNVYEVGEFNILEYQTFFFNSKPFIYGFYHDAGLVGVLLISFFIGSILSFIHRLSCKNGKYVLLIMFLQKAVFCAFFGNYFFGETTLFFPYVIGFILCLSLQKQVRSQC